MRIVALGVGNAFSQQNYSASFLVGYENSWLLVDAPHPLRRMLKEARTSTPDLPEVQDLLGIQEKIRLIHYPDELDVEYSPLPCLKEGQEVLIA